MAIFGNYPRNNATAPIDPKVELGRIADTLRDLNARELTARAEQYRLIRGMLADGHTWDQAQFAAQVSRPTVMRAVRDGKRAEREAEQSAEAQRQTEAESFHRSMGQNPGLTPRP